MKLRFTIFIFVFTLGFKCANAQGIGPFVLSEGLCKKDQKVLYSSISEYVFGDPDDTTNFIPDLDSSAEFGYSYAILKDFFRKQVLKKVNISETDSVFVYDYFHDQLWSFKVKDLKLIAILNVYENWFGEGEKLLGGPFPDYYYQISFDFTSEINLPIDSLYNSFVCINKTNPFITSKIKPMVWKEVHFKQYPEGEAIKTRCPEPIKDYYGKSFQSEYDDYMINIQRIHRDLNSDYFKQRLWITIKNSSKIIFETTILGGEGSSFAPLNGVEYDYFHKLQYIGPLFKDQGPVMFGLQFVSFGCPSIYLFNSTIYEIGIACDNRH